MKPINDSYVSSNRPAISARLGVSAVDLTVTGSDLDSQLKSVTGTITFIDQKKEASASWQANLIRNTWISSIKTGRPSDVDDAIRHFIDDRLLALHRSIVRSVEGVCTHRTMPHHLVIA